MAPVMEEKASSQLFIKCTTWEGQLSGGVIKPAHGNHRIVKNMSIFTDTNPPQALVSRISDLSQNSKQFTQEGCQRVIKHTETMYPILRFLLGTEHEKMG